ncbi:MAG: hypothetical protein WBF42_05170, partial [Terracidiphilus sp.]
ASDNAWADGWDLARHDAATANPETRLGARKRLISGVAALALLVCVIWPAILNRQPFLYPDTTSYVRTADPAVYRFTGFTTWWTAPHSAETSAQQEAAGSAPATSQPPSSKVILVSRSIYYGLLLYVGFVTSHFWLSTLLQGAALLLGVYLALRMLDQPVWPAFFYVGFALCVVSDAPFFAGFLTPDLFAGIAILICAVLLARDRKITPKDAALAYTFLLTCLLFHESILLIVGGLAAAALLLNTVRRSWKNSGGVTIILAALLSAWLGYAFFHAMVRHATGQGTVRLPFLSARLVADGPGRDYLHATCPANGFVLCQFPQLPAASDDFLWNLPQDHGVFILSPPAIQKKLSDEDAAFALAVLRYNPRGVLAHAATNSAAQLISFSLEQFSYPGTAGFDEVFPPSIVARLHRSAAYRGTIPIGAFTLLNDLVVCASAAFLVIASIAALRKRSAARHRIWAATGWMIAGVILNAIICGSASEVLPRYQARVIWLLPLAVLLLELPKRIRPWRRHSASADEPVLTARSLS